jgi:hypothetical protein
LDALLHRHHYLHHSHKNISNNLQILIYPALYLYRLDIPRACITPIDNGIIHESERQYYKFPPGSGITEFPYGEVSTIWRIKALNGKDCNGVRVFNGNWKNTTLVFYGVNRRPMKWLLTSWLRKFINVMAWCIFFDPSFTIKIDSNLDSV